jgi:hypothetical protein
MFTFAVSTESFPVSGPEAPRQGSGRHVLTPSSPLLLCTFPGFIDAFLLWKIVNAQSRETSLMEFSRVQYLFIVIFWSILVFCGTGGQNQGLMHAGRVLYHWAPSLSQFWSVLKQILDNVFKLFIPTWATLINVFVVYGAKYHYHSQQDEQ